MDFIEPSFIFIFLPVFFLLHTLASKKFRNIILLIASIIFFFNNHYYQLLVLFLSISINFYLGRKIEIEQQDERVSRRYLLWGIVFNAGMLLFFKLLEVMDLRWLSGFFPFIKSDTAWQIILPLGLSYITFQNISYLVDVFNEVCKSEKKLINYLLYTLLFPKILVGPIVLYRDLKYQLQNREINIDRIAQGARRFIIGLAKKALIADALGRTIKNCLNLDGPKFSTGLAWFILLGYALELYFDFSGYTDMALGIGRMLGFSFVENFNYPYIAESVTDFWRRWHISLSSWVREYIFIPLEFKRRKEKFLRQQSNIIIAFLIMGLWHGPTINFVIYGLIHGLALALEMSFLSKLLNRVWRPLRHIYTLSIVLIGWVFFRTPSPDFAVKFLGRLVGFGGPVDVLPFPLTRPLPIIDPSVWLAFFLGIFFCLPIAPWIMKWVNKFIPQNGFKSVIEITFDVILIGLFIFSMASISSATFVGNIYADF